MAHKPTFTAVEESKALDLLPPLTRRAIVTCREPFSPSTVLKIFTDNEWPLTAGEYDAAVADRLVTRDYAVHGETVPTLH